MFGNVKAMVGLGAGLGALLAPPGKRLQGTTVGGLGGLAGSGASRLGTLGLPGFKGRKFVKADNLYAPWAAEGSVSRVGDDAFDLGLYR